MIEGVGIDNVEVGRMRELLGKNNHFRDKVFTLQEIEYCGKQFNSAESFAARFAAKEAFTKALGTGFIGDLEFSQIEVCSDSFGKPFISLSGAAKSIVETEGIKRMHLSLTHTETLASAIVILEK